MSTPTSTLPPTPAPEPNFGQKLLAELPDLLILAELANSNYRALPHPTKGVDYGKALGFKDGSLMMTMLAAFDTIKGDENVTLDEVAALLGVEPGGVLGRAIHIGEALAK